MNKIQKFLTVVFFIAIFVVLIYFIQNYGIEPLRNKVESMGIWAPFGIFILRGVSIILPALPSSAYSLLAGSLLGFQKGYMTIIFSDIVFCQAAFFIARNYGRVPVGNLTGKKAIVFCTYGSPQFAIRTFFLNMPTKRLRRGVFNICGIKDVIYKRYFAVPFVSDKKRKKFLDDVKETVNKL